jgi:imidazole glycerol-phosphate synthase subunit HisH
MTVIAVIDYDMGNLHSACKGLEFAFDPAMQHIRDRHLEKPIKQAIASGKPFLGICLGMQILFDGSEEGTEPGLGIIAGTVKRFQPEPGITIPHMGWNQLELTQPHSPLWSELSASPWMYFVHSYYAAPDNPVVTAATTTHGSQKATVAIAQDNLMAVQFHPEKSADDGLQILSNFVKLVNSRQKVPV